MIRFDPIASSSAGNAYKLSTDDGSRPLLLDCGLSGKRLRESLDFQVSEVGGCLLSHSHGDHAQGIKTLLDSAVSVYAHPQTWDALRISSPYSHSIVPDSPPIAIDKWLIRAFSCVHDAEGTIGFLIANGFERVVYLTDSAYSKHDFPGLTRLFVECNHSVELMRKHSLDGNLATPQYKRIRNNHMSLETLVSWLDHLDTSNLREVVLLHLSDGNSDEQAFKREIQRKTGAIVRVAGKSGGLF